MFASLPHHRRLFSLCIFLLLFGSKATGVSLGAIVDASSRISKQERIAMQMAIDDFYKINNTTTNRPLLHIRNSGGSPVQAALAAMDLIENEKVEAIVGLRSFDEATVVGELGCKSQVPILSLAGTAPSGPFQRWPFLVQATQSKYTQMRAIAAVIATWQWKRVNFLYEDISSATATIIQPLISALQEVDCEIEHIVSFPSYQPSLLSNELEKLKEGQSRVFIVHSSLSLASHMFVQAKEMGLMENDSVWITTDVLTDLLDSANSSVISSMQGVIGIKSYFPQTGKRFKDFFQRFQRKFRLVYGKEFNSRPGIFALQAYDAVWAVALAIETRTTRIQAGIENSTNVLDGQRLLEEISGASFEGLTGKFRFTESDDHHQLAPAQIFQLVNVVGKIYKEVGFWSEQSGFSRGTSSANQDIMEKYSNTSTEILGEILWPGGTMSIPRGWALPSSKIPIKIGVPARSAFKQFVNVVYNLNGTTKPKVTGLAIDVFKEAMHLLPYKFSPEFIPYAGPYDALIEQMSKTKKEEAFDLVVGDTSIVAYRCEYADFSQPWSDSGVQMVVYRKSQRSNKAWLFIKPFTKRLWALTVAINIFNGLVIWFIERTHNPGFSTGSLCYFIGTLIWLAFSTLFAQHGYKLHNNFSRMIMVVWLFVAIIILQSYTASLTTLLTVPQLKSSVDISEIKNQEIGCDGGSFIYRYLVDILHFSPQNIKNISSYEDYPEALKRGEIAAAFLNVPHVKVFLSCYSKDFVVVGPTYKVGGFGFVFPRKSYMLHDFSKAVLQLIEKGRVKELENEMIRSNNCSSNSSSDSEDEERSLDLTSFWGLFVVTIGTSIVSLIVFVFCNTADHQRQSFELPLIEPSSYNISDHHPLIDEQYMFASELMDTQEEHICSLESQDAST